MAEGSKDRKHLGVPDEKVHSVLEAKKEIKNNTSSVLTVNCIIDGFWSMCTYVLGKLADSITFYILYRGEFIPR